MDAGGVYFRYADAAWILSAGASNGITNVRGATFSPCPSGTWMVTLARPLPASSGTRTEPSMCAPHQRSLSVVWVTMGGAPGFLDGNSTWAMGLTSGRTEGAKVPLPRPGVPTRTCRHSEP